MYVSVVWQQKTHIITGPQKYTDPCVAFTCKTRAWKVLSELAQLTLRDHGDSVDDWAIDAVIWSLDVRQRVQNGRRVCHVAEVLRVL